MEVNLTAFLVISVLAIVTPGPDMVLVLKNALFGRRYGILTAFGVITGAMVWAIAASFGVVGVLLASEPLFLAVKYAGAAYLVYLGVQTLLSALRFRDSGSDLVESGERDGERVTPRTAFREGIICNLGNPKMAVFFATLLPQFVTTGQTSFYSLLALGTVFCSMAMVWLVGYATLVARSGDFLRRPRIRRAIETMTGTVLVAFGLKLATASR